MWKIGIVTPSLPHLSEIHMLCLALPVPQGSEEGGRSGFVCVSPCSPPGSLDAELLSRNRMWAVCSGSWQICCFSTAVHPSHPCMSKHATLGCNTAGFSSAEKLTCEALLICTASGQHWPKLTTSMNTSSFERHAKTEPQLWANADPGDAAGEHASQRPSHALQLQLFQSR